MCFGKLQLQWLGPQWLRGGWPGLSSSAEDKVYAAAKLQHEETPYYVVKTVALIQKLNPVLHTPEKMLEPEPNRKHPAWETNERKWKTNARKWETSRLGTGPQAPSLGDNEKKWETNEKKWETNERKWETSRPGTRPDHPAQRRPFFKALRTPNSKLFGELFLYIQYIYIYMGLKGRVHSAAVLSLFLVDKYLAFTRRTACPTRFLSSCRQKSINT